MLRKFSEMPSNIFVVKIKDIVLPEGVLVESRSLSKPEAVTSEFALAKASKDQINESDSISKEKTCESPSKVGKSDLADGKKICLSKFTHLFIVMECE